jgi:hypothetical protein
MCFEISTGAVSMADSNGSALKYAASQQDVEPTPQ